ncbi:MAG: glycosyltransferase family 2 protein [Planctomycetes bacterium]|nr:glycosyltransferase family 2 protein [Planctomycetota bacterium]
MNVLVAIPVYNEIRYVADVLREVRRYAEDVLVVDDGSTDGTSEALAAVDGIRVIRHQENLGYGRALINAFRCAVCCGMDWIITMDCDGQHEPAAIPRFVEAAAEDDCDIVSGSRYLDDSPAGTSPPPSRRRINTEITALLNERLGLELTDAFCGFKAYRVNALERLNLTEHGYAMPMQLWVRAAYAGLKIREIPVRLIYNDPDRAFGGPLDDPGYRKRHYLRVFYNALADEENDWITCQCADASRVTCRC